MLNAGFQYLEQRDANDKITKDGVVGKNSPFATSDNSGIYDIIAEDLRWLKENIDDVKDTSDLEAIKQSVIDMYNEMKNDSSFGEAAAKAQAEEAKKQAQAALESATNAKTYYDDITNKSTEVNDTIAEIKTYIEKAEVLNKSNKELEQSIAGYAAVATNKANEASDSATKAATSESAAKASETRAKSSETNSKTSETNSKASETNAAKSASNSATSATASANSAKAAADSVSKAKTSEANASTSKSNAATSETNAKSYMDTAKEYMQKTQETLAAAQAIQSIVDTAKANAEKCLADVEAVRDSLAKMITYQGSVDNYSDLPTNPQVGYSYNVKNADKEHGVNAGDNLVWNGEDWDNFGGAIDMSLFAELGKDVNFNTVTATTFTGNLDGTADRATADANGNELADPQKYMHVSRLENADFNNIRATGVYTCMHSTYTNTPVNSWGVLRVYQIINSSIKQEYIPGDKLEVYVRHCIAGTWNAWSKVNAGNATNDSNGNNIVDTYETKSDSNTKFNGTTSYTNRLQRNKDYKVGDIAYSPNLPSWAYLECVTAGTTGATEPDFSEVK